MYRNSLRVLYVPRYCSAYVVRVQVSGNPQDDRILLRVRSRLALPRLPPPRRRPISGIPAAAQQHPS
eukprot:4328178-Pleurochrysis_carterae.AAC.4